MKRLLLLLLAVGLLYAPEEPKLHVAIQQTTERYDIYVTDDKKTVLAYSRLSADGPEILEINAVKLGQQAAVNSLLQQVVVILQSSINTIWSNF